MTEIFSVPAFSQHKLVTDSKWNDHICGIASLFMVIKFLDPLSDITGDDLLKRCIDLDGYIHGIGWKHKELALAAESYGYHAKSYDWFQKPIKEAFELMKKELETAPVIASVYNKFEPNNGGHLIVVRGIDDEYVHINDPAEKEIENIYKKISIETFLNGWKRRIIVVRKNNPFLL